MIFLEKRHREARLSQPGDHTPIFWVMQHLDLTDEEAAALIKEFADITGNDRYPFSPGNQTLRAILAKLRPEPAREPRRRRRSTRHRGQLPPEGADSIGKTKSCIGLVSP